MSKKKGLKKIYGFVLGHIYSHSGPHAAHRPWAGCPDTLPSQNFFKGNVPKVHRAGEGVVPLFLSGQSALINWIRAPGPKRWKQVRINFQVESRAWAVSCAAEGLDLPAEEDTE